LLELLPQYTITEAIDFFSQQLTAAALQYFDLEPLPIASFADMSISWIS
jgi:hypothetical protein